MKKRAIAIFAALMAFTACTSQGINENAGTAESETTEAADTTVQTETSAEDTGEVTAPDEAVSSADVTEESSADEDLIEEFDLSVYDEILERTAHAIAAGSPDDAQDVWLMELLMYTEDDAASHICYAYADINKDGREELIICPSDIGNAAVGTGVYSIYACPEGSTVPCCLAEGWSRNRFYITTDGRIHNMGSSGAAYSGHCIYHISGDGASLECEDFYFTDFTDEAQTNIGVYHNTTGEWDKDVSELYLENADNFTMFEEGLEYMDFVTTPFTALVSEEWEKKADIQVAELESTDTLDAYDSFNTGITENGVQIAVSSDTDANIILVSLTMNDDLTFDAAEIYETDIHEGYPFVTTVSFPGSIPAYGLEVTDAFGTRFFSLDMSGFDGSVEIHEIKVNNVDHARG